MTDNGLVTAILTSIKDLIKYRIIQAVDTGDKTYNSLLHTFFLAILALIMGYVTWENIQGYIGRFSKEFNLDYATKLTEKKKKNFRYMTWTASCVDFTEKFMIYFRGVYGCKDFPSYFHPDNPNVLAPGKRRGMDSICATCDFMPLYYNTNNVVGITRFNYGLTFYYSDEVIMRELIEKIKAIKTEGEPDINPKSCRIWTDSSPGKIIYPDRTMDMFVSRHKSSLISSLDNFIQANNSGALFGGFGTYNLGIMLYGPPGTGKTMVIKAVCNYLKMDALVIDLRKVNTKDKFKKIFDDMTTSPKIAVFDEFDFVQGIIKDRSDDKEFQEEFQDVILEDLKRRQLEVMKLLTDKDGKTNENIKKELDSIENSIGERNNRLTLETMLQVLDGIEEHRGRVIIATTNYINRIDSALLREGRFDLKIELGNFNNEESHELLYKMFSPTATKNELDLLASTKIKENIYTPTKLVNMAISCKNLKPLLEIIKE